MLLCHPCFAPLFYSFFVFLLTDCMFVARQATNRHYVFPLSPVYLQCALRSMTPPTLGITLPTVTMPLFFSHSLICSLSLSFYYASRTTLARYPASKLYFRKSCQSPSRRKQRRGRRTEEQSLHTYTLN